jgi:hypothetical protein
MRSALILGLFFAFLASPANATAETRYYILIFGSESTPRLARHTHTWATFVKANVQGEDASKYRIDEVFTISWMPANLRVRALRPFAQAGVNLDLETTLAHVLQRERVSQWGPFEISQELYELGITRRFDLESGAVKYKAIDPNFGPRARAISDCIHGISDIDPEYGRFYYLETRRFGEAASHWLAHQFVVRGRLINLNEDLDWINQQLGLYNYPIVRRPTPDRRMWLLDK